jgi:hypothetical protein
MGAILANPEKFHAKAKLFVTTGVVSPDIGLSLRGSILSARARPRRAGENFKLMPLAGPSMPCFNECAIDPYQHLLSWFVENLRVIDFLADDRFPRGSLLQCVCRQRAFGCVLWHD